MFFGRGLNLNLHVRALKSLGTPQEPDLGIEVLAGGHVLGVDAPAIGVPDEARSGS